MLTNFENSDFEIYSLLWKPPKSKKIVLPLQALAWLLLACYISNFSIKIAPHLHTQQWGQIFYEDSYFFHEIVTQSKQIKVWKIFHKIMGVEKFKHYFKKTLAHPLHCATLSFQLSASKKFLLSFSVKGPRSHIAPCRYGSTLED